MAKKIHISSLADSSVSAPRPVKAPAQIIQEWTKEPEVKQKLQACADAGIEALHQDMTLRVPRDEALRKNGFAEWLKIWKARLAPAIEAEFGKQFPNLVQPGLFDSLNTPEIWGQIELELLQYAIRGLTRAWSVRNLGDAIMLENPQRADETWVVSLKWRRDGRRVGSIVLDSDGNVITESSSTRQDVLARING